MYVFVSVFFFLFITEQRENIEYVDISWNITFNIFFCLIKIVL